MPVQTPLGIGEIVERSSVRGRSQVKVAGRGFSAWYDEAIVRPVGHLAAWENEDATENVDEDNSTTLPWNPDPQVENILSTQSTILPGEYGIDADERLHPADSLSFDERSEPEQPAPNPDLFAKGAALRDTLGPKYATWLLDAHVDHYNDPIQRFRDDPDREIGRLGHLLSDTLDEDTRHYGMLIEADREMRLAAWADVRNKASHLRSEGRVHVLDYAPDRIYASVDGDHGTYDVMVKRGNEYTGGQAVSNWHCSCKWGSWAFQRQYKHVGRLCSHALASLDEMQSRYLKDNPGHFERRRVATVTSEFTDWADDNGVPADLDGVSDFVMTHPDLSDDDIADLYAYAEDHQVRREVRDYEDPLSQNWPDVLTTQRGRLSPELVFPAEDDEGDRHEMVDVEKDERKTTGPDQIVHFSRKEARGVKDLFHEPKDDEVYKALPAELWHEQNFPGEEFNHGGGQMALMPMSELALHEARQIQAYYDMNGLQYPAELRHALTRTADSGQPKDLDDMMGVDSTTPLTTNPFEGGGYDLNALPGVKGGPNSSPATDADPTGGIMSGPYTSGAGASAPSAAGSGDNFYKDWYPGGSDASGTGSGTGSQTYGPTVSESQGGPGPSGAGTGGGSDWSPNGNTDPIAAGDYKIQSGDTLSDIAQRAGYGDNYQALFDQNKDSLTDPDMIQAGGTLHIPGLDTAGTDTGDAEGTPHMPAGTPETPSVTPDATAPIGTAGTGTGPAPGPTTDPTPGPDSVPDTSLGLSPTEPTNPGLTDPTKKASRYLTDADFEDGRYARVRTADLLEKLRELSDEPIPHGSAAAHNDEVREVVEELRDRGMDASQMVAALEATDPHQGFSGSGFDPKHTWGTSQSYVEKHERPHQVDVTNLDDSDEMIRYTEKESALDTTDVVRRFHADLQREGGASYLDGGAGGDFSDDAIAARADAMVRTAGRKFTLAEQRELEDESHPLGARNKPSYADLAGTHYVD